jgi:hypothetical protein
VVLEKKILNDPPNFYIFAIISLFEEDLALYLKNFDSPSPMDNLYHV